MNVAISRARAQDLDEVLSLLAEVDLPVEGVAEHFSGFFVECDGETVVGCVHRRPA